MLFEVIDLSKVIIHGGQRKSSQQRLQCKNSSVILSVYELFGIMLCQLFNHLMALHVRLVLYSFCVFIVFSSR
jgi:hypothetical protein